MIFREEIQLALRAFEKTLPDETAAADGNLRLDDMVTGAIRIDVRIEKDEDTHLLVAVQHEEPDEREDYNERKKGAFHKLHLESGNIKHAEGDGREDKARTKVRLDEDQKCRKCHHTRDRQKTLPCLEAGFVIRHEPCQTDDHDDFRKFRRLQRERADLDPALRPKRTRSGEFDDQKQDRIDPIEDGYEAIEFPVVKIERAPRDDKTADQEDPLLHDEVILPRLSIHIRMSGARNDQKTDDAKAQDSHQQRAVDAPPIPNEIHSAISSSAIYTSGCPSAMKGRPVPSSQVPSPAHSPPLLSEAASSSAKAGSVSLLCTISRKE